MITVFIFNINTVFQHAKQVKRFTIYIC